MKENFKDYLRQSNMAENTISAYVYAVSDFLNRHKHITK